MRLALVCLLCALICGSIYAEGAYTYNSRGKRDPFVPLVGVSTNKAPESLEDVMAIDDVELQGIASDAEGKLVAILNGEMVKKGYTIGRIVIKDISKNGVKLTIDETEYAINIYKDEIPISGGQND